MKIIEVLRDMDKIHEFLEKNGYKNRSQYYINADGSVDFNGDCYLTVTGPLPFKIGSVTNAIGADRHARCNIRANELNSLESLCPKSCGRFIIVSHTIDNLDGFELPANCGVCEFHLSKLNDLHDIHKKIPSLDAISFGDAFGVTMNIEKNILGLMKIKGLNFIEYGKAHLGVGFTEDDVVEKDGKLVSDLDGDTYTPAAAAFRIVAANYDKPNGIVLAQRRMIELDLDDFAEL